jgi:predicted permease
MPGIGEIWRRLLFLFHKRRFDRELEEEMRFHLEMKQGAMDPHEARRRFGNLTHLIERSRDAWGWGMIERFAQDLRFAFRTMRRTPGLTAAAALSLALGVGAASTLFSVMDGLWYRPLAVNDPDGLVYLQSRTPERRPDLVSYPDYLDIRKLSHTLSGLAASHRRGPFLGIDGVEESAMTDVVSDNYFTVLGVKAALGRVFTEPPDPQRTLVIGHNLWLRRFRGDPHVAGRQVTLGGRPFTVIGVAPAEFRGTWLWADMDLWVPMSAWGETQMRRDRSFTVVGRLRPGFTLDAARAELATIARNLAAAYPAVNKDYGAVLHSAREYQSAQAGAGGVLLAAVSAVLILLACANVANVLLARGEARRREMAVRVAIGCSRWRLVRQLLTESAALAALGAVAGLLLAAWLTRLVPLLLPPIPFLHFEFRIDHRVLAFAAVASAVGLFLFGLIPASRASRPDLAPTLKNDLHDSRAPLFSLRETLVVGQIALALVLLSTAGLLIRSFLHCLALDLGFARENALVTWVFPGMPEPQARNFYRELSGRVRAMPGVQRVALVRRVPLWPSEGGTDIALSLPNKPREAGAPDLRVMCTVADPGYFRTLGIRLLAGRDFTERDNGAGELAAVVSETMARRFWPGENPIGKLLVAGGRPRTVVGVVADVKVSGVLRAPEPYLYLPFGQQFSGAMTLVVKTAGDPLALAEPVKGEIRALAKTPPPEVATLASVIANATFEERSLAWLVSALGAIGVLLTSAGVYGVMSFVVARRTQEIGVRVALGASRGDVLALVFRRAATLAGIGAALGLAGALALSSSLASMVFGASPRDPFTLGAVLVLVLAIAALASLNPALRATRVDPLRAIRYD